MNSAIDISFLRNTYSINLITDESFRIHNKEHVEITNISEFRRIIIISRATFF